MALFERYSPRPIRTDSRWTVPFDGSFDAARFDSSTGRKTVGNRTRLKRLRKRLQPLQEVLHASRYYSVLCIFQALDAAGKDGTIRDVFNDLDPVGIRLASFKKPTSIELQHDFLWRTALELPRRGEIGIFNRSYYEEVLSVRVHPEYLQAQYPGGVPNTDELWPARYHAIREYERHLATANTVILKFWLHVSPKEQAQRFLDRITEPDKRWKFSAHDVYESGFRPAYDEAVIDMFNATSMPWAPWFMIPADNKEFMRQQVAEIIVHALEDLPLEYPQPDVRDQAEMDEIAARLKDRISK